MEINITSLADIETTLYSDSIANSGLSNIGELTWDRAKRANASFITADNREDFEAWIGGFGAWEPKEVEEWSLNECNALFIQFVSGDLSEGQSLAPGDGLANIDWDEYQELSEAGQVSSSLFESNGDLFFYAE